LWLSLIGANREEEVKMLATKDPVMEKAVGVLKKLSADERARLIYESREKARRDEMARLYGARNEGEIIGLAKGRAEGLINGKKEIAQHMLTHGMDIDLISSLTGLDKDELTRLHD
jgi:predicted transposase/invertase (TIGR01784 family)